MIDANLIARSHFTKKADGESSFYQFLKEVKLLGEGLKFKVEINTPTKKGHLFLVAESWGGYFNANDEWIVFVCWRASKGNICIYSHWYWDSENQCAYGRRDYGFQA